MTDPASYIDWFRSAAPYFDAHRWRCIVVHFDGEVAFAPDFGDLVNDLALLHSLGVRLVLVPGMEPQLERRLKERLVDSRTVDGVRILPADALPAIGEAAAEVSIELTARLSMGLANSPSERARVRVATGNYITARPMGIIDGQDLGYSGRVRGIDGEAIEKALDTRAVVVVPPVGYSPTGEVFCLDAQDAATGIATELCAHKLMLLGPDAPLRTPQGQRVGALGLGEAMELYASLGSTDAAQARKLRRLETALRAARNGVRRVHLLDSTRRGALALELYTRDGEGTMVAADVYDDLRRATIDDVGGILELIEPLEREGALVRRERRDIEASIRDYFVEQRDGTIVACAASHYFPAESTMELACLAVHPGYRRSGRAAQLLAAVESEARRLGAERLFVLTTQATHWFSERGFEESSLESLPVERRALYNPQRRSRVLLKHLASELADPAPDLVPIRSSAAARIA